LNLPKHEENSSKISSSSADPIVVNEPAPPNEVDNIIRVKPKFV